MLLVNCFRSRNREIFHFKGCITPFTLTGEVMFPSRNQDAFGFKTGLMITRLSVPYCFDLVIERFLGSRNTTPISQTTFGRFDLVIERLFVSSLMSPAVSRSNVSFHLVIERLFVSSLRLLHCIGIRPGRFPSRYREAFSVQVP